MAVIIDARVQQKTDTEANWLANPLVLLSGECAFVLGTDDETPINFKIGDGTKTFAELPYWINYAANVVVDTVAPPGPLPNPGSAGKLIFLTGGSYTNIGGGTNPLVLPDNALNICFWNGTTWSLAISILVDSTLLTNYVNKTTDITKGSSIQWFDATHLITSGFTVSGYRNDTYIRASDGAMIIGGVAVGWQLAHIIIPAGVTQFTVSGLITVTSKAWRFTDAAGNLISGQFGTATSTTQTFDVPAAVIASGGCFDINVKRSDEAGTAKDTVMINEGATVAAFESYGLNISKILELDLKAKNALQLQVGNFVPTPLTANNATPKAYVDAADALKANQADIVDTAPQLLVAADAPATSGATNYGTWAVDAAGGITLSAISPSTRIWNLLTFKPIAFDVSFVVTSNQRGWLMLGYKDVDNICAISISGVGLFGRVINVNTNTTTNPTGTFTVSQTSSLTAPTVGQIVRVVIAGDSLKLYKDGALILTYSIAALIANAVSANLQNIQLGIVGFNAAGTAITPPALMFNSFKWNVPILIKTLVQGLVASGTNNTSGLIGFISGDSISDPTATYNGMTNGVYHWQLGAAKFGITMYNDAISATSIGIPTIGSNVPLSDPTRLARIIANGIPDFYIIFMGTNDFDARAVPLGDINTLASDRTKFYGAYKAVLDYCAANCPTTKIFMCSPIHRGDRGFPEQSTVNLSGPGGTGVFLSDYVKAVEDLAKLYGHVYVNLNQNSGVTYANMQTGIYGTSTEKLHPPPIVHKLKLMPILFNTINQHFKP